MMFRPLNLWELGVGAFALITGLFALSFAVNFLRANSAIGNGGRLARRLVFFCLAFAVWACGVGITEIYLWHIRQFVAVMPHTIYTVLRIIVCASAWGLLILPSAKQEH